MSLVHCESTIASLCGVAQFLLDRVLWWREALQTRRSAGIAVQMDPCQGPLRPLEDRSQTLPALVEQQPLPSSPPLCSPARADAARPSPLSSLAQARLFSFEGGHALPSKPDLVLLTACQTLLAMPLPERERLSHDPTPSEIDTRCPGGAQLGLPPSSTLRKGEGRKGCRPVSLQHPGKEDLGRSPSTSQTSFSFNPTPGLSPLPVCHLVWRQPVCAPALCAWLEVCTASRIAVLPSRQTGAPTGRRGGQRLAGTWRGQDSSRGP